jgi:CubicO group peptidase (beta-lactamase class C family)
MVVSTSTCPRLHDAARIATSMPSRRTVLASLGALAMSTPPAVASRPWPTATSTEAGFADDMADKLEWGVKSGLLKGFHGIVVTRGGKLVLERYFDGQDWAWGRDLGVVKHNPETLHDLRSVTKSVVSILYGIALDRGLVPPLDAPVMAQFPEYADLTADPKRQLIKIEHVINMTTGFEWNEQLPYTDPKNAEIMMEMAKDRYRFILDRPIVSAPGARWNYNGGCNALIGRLIEKGTQQTIAAFAKETLFAPLGIDRFEWIQGSDGVPSAASGLRLTARDLARIGTLMLAKGENEGRRIVSAGWIEGASAATTPTGDGLMYGRSWFQLDTPVPALRKAHPTLMGFGNGGQRLCLMPALDVACVIFSGRYNEMDSWISPTRLWREIILGNLERA